MRPRSDGPHPRRSGLRTHFLPPGTASSPRIRLHGGDPLARLPHPRRRDAPAPPDDDLRTRLRARRHAVPYGPRDPYGQRTHRLHRRQIRRRRRDGDDPHHGDIFVAADTIPPRIRPLFSEGADLGGARSIRFRVSDNFSGIASCTLLIDGRWVPCDRFPMQGTLVHAFDLPAAKKRRSVQLTVTDRCGNTARWEGTFWR